MSHVSGQVSGKNKSGKKTTVKFSTRAAAKLPPAKAAKFLRDFRALLKRYGIPRG
jgi:hypothetical protein